MKIKQERSPVYSSFKQSLQHLLCFFLLVFIPFFSARGKDLDIDPELLEKFNLVTVNGEILVEVSMKNLLTLALERATTMDIVFVNQQIARDKHEAMKSLYHPTLTTTVGLQKVVSTTGTNMSGDVTNPYSGTAADFLNMQAADTTALSTTWSKKTKRGIQYSLGYEKAATLTSTGSYQEQGDAFDGWEKVDDPLYTDSLTAKVMVPLFQDWGDINRSPEFKSKIGLESTEVESRKSVLDMLELVAGIYWDLVGVEENIQTLEASETLAEQFVEDTKTRMALGVLDPIEVKQGESQLLIVQQNLLSETFQKNQIEDQIKVALNLQDIPYGYRPTESMKQRSLSYDFEALLNTVYKNSPDLAMLKSQLDLNAIELREAQNKSKTDLDFSLQYRFNGFGQDMTESSTTMSETKLHDYQIGLSWNLPLFDKQTPQTIRQQTLENQRLMLQIDNLKAQLKVSLQSVLRSLKLAERGIKLATTSVALARDLLEKETEKFKLGNTTSFRVSQVQQDLTDAYKNKTLAQVNYEKSYLQLLIITGQIFEEYDLPENY